MNTGRDYIRAHVQAAERHRTMLDSLMRPLILRALDAAGHAPDSAPGCYALDRAQDVGCVVERAGYFAAYYGARRLPRRVDAQDAALSLALLAEAETSRGVRTVGAK